MSASVVKIIVLRNLPLKIKYVHIEHIFYKNFISLFFKAS